jgi:SET domain-containing protein
MNKKDLLFDLRHNSYATLKPSGIHGIGVFAICDIPKGTKNIFSNDRSEWHKVEKKEVETLPEHVRALVENHCLYDNDHYFIPSYGFKIFDMVVFINHSDIPNLISVNEGEYFEALRDIVAGEELFVDYGMIVEDDESH